MEGKITSCNNGHCGERKEGCRDLDTQACIVFDDKIKIKFLFLVRSIVKKPAHLKFPSLRSNAGGRQHAKHLVPKRTEAKVAYS
jgi:hypothetical protein